LEKQRDDFDQSPDRNHQNDQNDHQEIVGLDLLVRKTLRRVVVL